MANVNDYLDWRGDIPISEEFGINEIDNMIFARISYLLFDKIQLEEEETIESASKKMKNFKNEEFNYNGDKELITKLGKSKRFKDLVLTDYVKNNDFEAERQFSAITIHINKELMYISFEGTDGTILGWKEDFNMAFMKNIAAQISGKEYLEKVSDKYKNKKMIIGGHSKGGNVAIYSAVTVNKKIQERILKVVNYDGPGFDEEFINSIENLDILDRVYTYIPQSSVIGRILEHEEGYEVVESIQKGIYQHDIYSWQVKGKSMIKLKETTKSSEVMNETMKTWLRNTTVEQRRLFFDAIFDIFNSTSASKFSEISISWKTSMPKIVDTYKGLAEEDKKNITEMIKLFGKSYFSSIRG
ncbi:MAG: DUF2974 domain-containing protein [Clostridia bacterium]|nr:DUF2974 domain-containing protein [Clostridia bacterium]